MMKVYRTLTIRFCGRRAESREASDHLAASNVLAQETVYELEIDNDLWGDVFPGAAH